MITLQSLAGLFGISPQTIRMYERYGILRLDRSASNNYRVFDFNAFTALIKSRILQGFGFKMKDITRMMNNMNYEEIIRSLDRQSDLLGDEIVMLERRKKALDALTASIREIQEKQGTCDLVTSPGYYLYPVLQGETVRSVPGRAFLKSLNEYAFLRQDVDLIPRSALADGKHVYDICYGIEEAHAHAYGLRMEGAIHIPSRTCVKAYFTCPAASIDSYVRHLQFALDFMEAHRLALNGDILLFLPFTSGSADGIYYHYALLPVTDDSAQSLLSPREPAAKSL